MVSQLNNKEKKNMMPSVDVFFLGNHMFLKCANGLKTMDARGCCVNPQGENVPWILI